MKKNRIRSKVDAVAAGNFHVYAVAAVDDAVEILTGQTAGERLMHGTYPKGTINAAVQQRLRETQERWVPKKKRPRRYGAVHNARHDDDQ